MYLCPALRGKKKKKKKSFDDDDDEKNKDICIFASYLTRYYILSIYLIYLPDIKLLPAARSLARSLLEY